MPNKDLIEYMDEQLDMLKTAILILALSTFLLLGIFTCANNADAGMYDHQGMELSVAGASKEAGETIGCVNDDYDFNWIKMSLFNRHDIDDNWNVVTAGDLGYMRWASTNEAVDSDKDVFSIGAELIVYRKIYKTLSLGGGVGLSTLSHYSGLPHLGNSGLYGTATGRLKLDLSKSYGLEASLDHISDLLQEDVGNNAFALKLYYMFN